MASTLSGVCGAPCHSHASVGFPARSSPSPLAKSAPLRPFSSSFRPRKLSSDSRSMRPSTAVRASDLDDPFANGDNPSNVNYGKFLEELSIEYDSVWDTKPAWCQPWTIVLTGVSGILGSWEIIHSPVLSAIVTLLVSAWWFIFLYSYPKEYKEMIAERRRMIQQGVEDTYGSQR